MRKYELLIEEEFAKIAPNLNGFSARGVSVSYSKQNGVCGTEITLEENNELGKAPGKYYTFALPDFSSKSKTKMITKLTETFIKLIKNKCERVLIVGMGNEKIISDSLGVDVVGKISVLDIMQKNKRLSFAKFCPGVFSNSGIESIDLVKGVVEIFNPNLVIVVDSLCTKTVDRLGTSFQVCNTGIVAGAATGSFICDLSAENLGVREVLSVGVPVVIYVDALIDELIKNSQTKIQGDLTSASLNLNNIDGIFSPKDIDYIIDFSSDIVSQAIFNLF